MDMRHTLGCKNFLSPLENTAMARQLGAACRFARRRGPRSFYLLLISPIAPLSLCSLRVQELLEGRLVATIARIFLVQAVCPPLLPCGLRMRAWLDATS